MTPRNPSQFSMPLVEHLRELRDRLLRSVVLIVVIFIGLYFFSGDIYMVLVEPLNTLLPDKENASLIATGVASPLFGATEISLCDGRLAGHALYPAPNLGLYCPGALQA